MSVEDFFVLLINTILFLLVIGIIPINCFIALKRSIVEAIVIPAILSPILIYNLVKAIYWITHGRFLTMYLICSIYCLIVIVSTIVCRMIKRKRR